MMIFKAIRVPRQLGDHLQLPNCLSQLPEFMCPFLRWMALLREHPATKVSDTAVDVLNTTRVVSL